MIVETLAAIADGKTSCSASVQSCLNKAQAANQLFSYINSSGAGVDAAPAPLAGVALALSNQVMVSGFPAEAGSALLAGFVSPFDATAVARLRAAGAAFIGIAAGPEFGLGLSADISSPAKAVAAGAAHAAMGVDSNGCFRQAAAAEGLVGFKPSFGLLSRHGLVSVAPNLETFALAVEDSVDAALLLDHAAGYDPNDILSQADAKVEISAQAKGSVKGKKVGIPVDLVGKAAAGLRETAARLGLVTVDVNFPSVSLWRGTHSILFHAQAGSQFGRFDGIRFGTYPKDARDWNSVYLKARNALGDKAKLTAMLGAFALSTEGIDKYHEKARFARQAICLDFVAAWKECDILFLDQESATTYGFGANLSGCAALAHGKSGIEVWAPAGSDSLAIGVGACL